MDVDDGTPAKKTAAGKSARAPKQKPERKDAPTKSTEKQKAATGGRACAAAATPKRAATCGDESFEAHLMGLASTSERRPAAVEEERKVEREKPGLFGRVQPGENSKQDGRYKWLEDVQPVLGRRLCLPFTH